VWIAAPHICKLSGLMICADADGPRSVASAIVNQKYFFPSCLVSFLRGLPFVKSPSYHISRTAALDQKQ
jgi:hypothetical protein